jgi:hypothetical protein
MKVTRALIIGLFALLSTGKVYSDELNDLSIEYLQLSKTKETFDMTIEAYVQQLSANNPNADKEEIRSFFNTYMGWGVLKEPTTKLVSQTLTIQELRDINGFYRTSSGKSLAEKSPKMAADISNLIGANLQKAMQDMQQKNYSNKAN